jgi:hypothetical protein
MEQKHEYDPRQSKATAGQITIFKKYGGKPKENKK